MADNNIQQEEVDLGKLFQMIGKGFSNLFNFIGDFFKSIFHYIILILIFFRKKIIIIGGATIIGIISGYLFDLNKPMEYTSNMVIDTNYGSGHRLYEQVDLLNNLIADSDFIKLSEIFNISPSEASKLNLFIVEPYDKEKNIIKDYDTYLKETDTIFTRDFTIANFKKRVTDTDFSKQNIIAYSFDKKIFSKLKKGVLLLTENDFFGKRHETTILALANMKKVIEKDLKVVDSLRVLYKTVALLSAKNDVTSGTNIDLGAKQTVKNRDIELFDENINLIQRLNVVNKELASSDYVIAVISEFNDGEKYNLIQNSKWFRYGILGFLLSLLGLLGLKLNTYLSRYEK